MLHKLVNGVWTNTFAFLPPDLSLHVPVFTVATCSTDAISAEKVFKNESGFN